MYWIVAKGRDGTKIRGKTALLGPFNTEFTADEKADELETDSKVIYLPTRDPSRASRMLKAKRVEQNPKLWEEAYERVSHKYK
jgi:hypothetical protein